MFYEVKKELVVNTSHRIEGILLKWQKKNMLIESKISEIKNLVEVFVGR